MTSFDFDAVDHLTFAAVGEPGQRVFMLQAADATTTMTLKLEKQQVRTLCAYIAELLENMGRPGHLPEDLELREPYEIAWVAGPIGVQRDELLDRIVITIDSAETDEEFVTDTPSARIVATREQSAALIIQGTTLVESGRPPCPLCGHPLDPQGHACPRTNGNRPPTL